jgi:integrase/recombinase XerD
MSAAVGQLRVQRSQGGWALGGDDFDGLGLVNDFLAYLADRNHSLQTARAYAYDLLHFERWMVAKRLSMEAVDTDVLLRYLGECRAQGAAPPAWRERVLDP